MGVGGGPPVLNTGISQACFSLLLPLFSSLTLSLFTGVVHMYECVHVGRGSLGRVCVRVCVELCFFFSPLSFRALT